VVAGCGFGRALTMRKTSSCGGQFETTSLVAPEFRHAINLGSKYASATRNNLGGGIRWCGEDRKEMNDLAMSSRGEVDIS
jgi:hypothetical protein